MGWFNKIYPKWMITNQIFSLLILLYLQYCITLYRCCFFFLNDIKCHVYKEPKFTPEVNIMTLFYVNPHCKIRCGETTIKIICSYHSSCGEGPHGWVKGSWTLLNGMTLHGKDGLTHKLKRCQRTLNALRTGPHNKIVIKTHYWFSRREDSVLQVVA